LLGYFQRFGPPRSRSRFTSHVALGMAAEVTVTRLASLREMRGEEKMREMDATAAAAVVALSQVVGEVNQGNIALYLSFSLSCSF
jgi:hypothetical protein